MQIAHLKISSGQKRPFKAHTGPGWGERYLAIALDEASLRDFRTKIHQTIGRKLLHTGEAHLTVLTPPEYADAFLAKVSIEKLSRWAEQRGVQSLPFEVTAVGSFAKVVDELLEETFFLICQSPALLEFRRELARTFAVSPQFNPDIYHPHVTIGYTRCDWHASDGARKDFTSADVRFLSNS